MTEDSAAAEAEIRLALEKQDFQTAATLALEAYGTEIYSFIRARLRAAVDADEAFSMFGEDLWKGFPGFAFRSSVRGWLYALARNAATRYAASPQRRPDRNVPLSVDTALAALVQHARTEIQPHQRTDVQDKVRLLRERLSLEDQTLLILHVDRNLPWREVVLVMQEAPTPLDESELRREAARLRKRFERVKSELRAMAIEEGLLSP